MSLLDKVFSRKPPERSEFAQIVIKAFEGAGVSGVEYRESDFALKIPGRDATVFLHNSYSNYCLVPKHERKAIVDKLIATFAAIPEIPADFAAAQTHLMPVVRDAAFYNLTQIRTSKDGSQNSGTDWQAKPLTGGLILGLAYDGEHSITMLNRKTLEGWGTGFDLAFAAAKDNLWEKTDPEKFGGNNGVYWGEWGDSYDSSRMLFPELIYRLSVDGDPVVFVPNRDALFVTGRNNMAGLRLILKTGGESHFNQGHPISPDLFILDDGVWRVWIPQELELHDLWIATRRRRDQIDYAQQKQVLDELKDFADVFVSSFTVFTREDKSVFSGCVWPRDVETLLPRTDMIAFVLDEENRDSFMVLWEAALPIIGDLLEEEPELIPVRYWARQFPSEAQIARLRNVARNR
ncbi:MAG TPA: hypothetical protein VKV39_18315 [Candidatus Sulfotelmatobacter sp.]|nr:hypothetical protein [Candidatus Sulfotelmatobacter sp.]